MQPIGHLAVFFWLVELIELVPTKIDCCGIDRYGITANRTALRTASKLHRKILIFQKAIFPGHTTIQNSKLAHENRKQQNVNKNQLFDGEKFSAPVRSRREKPVEVFVLVRILGDSRNNAPLADQRRREQFVWKRDFLNILTNLNFFLKNNFCFVSAN